MLRVLASVKLTIVLLTLLAVAGASGSVLEASWGREYAKWFVFDSVWLRGLLALLGLNALLATLLGLLQRPRQRAVLAIYGGLLCLLVGALLTSWLGAHGQLRLSKGEQIRHLMLPHQSVISIRRPGVDQPESVEFPFHAGPTDWQDNVQRDLGSVGSLRVKVLKYYRHAQAQSRWVADSRDNQGVALQLELSGPGGHAIAQDWLAASRYGGTAVIGPTQFKLLPIHVRTMEQDVFDPPAGDMGRAGILSIHCDGQMQRVHVDEQIGRRIAVGQSGVEVEIVEYLPAARPTPNGRFFSAGDRPTNPLLELKVHQLPGRDEPLRQIAMAKAPLLNLDGVHGTDCPVAFWYHHPSVMPEVGAEFIQMPDKSLYCRGVIDGAYSPVHGVGEGSSIDLGTEYQVTIQRYLPDARQETWFQSIAPTRDQLEKDEAAVLLDVAYGGSTHQVWLRRQDPLYGSQKLATAEGPIVVSFGYKQVPLGYTLQLDQPERHRSASRIGLDGISSTVRILQSPTAEVRPHRISIDQPLALGRFTLYQAEVREVAPGLESSVLTASYDPGRYLKYLGAWLIGGGICFLLLARRRMAIQVARLAMVWWMAATVSPAMAQQRQVPAAGGPWRSLPVVDGGRLKPLDTFARETLRAMSRSASMKDPDSGRRLDSTTLYVKMLLRWQGWDRDAASWSADVAPGAAAYFQLHQPDQWDMAPLLPIDDPQLRIALGLARDQQAISPRQLCLSRIKLPGQELERPFLRWTEQLAKSPGRPLTRLEQQSVELADRLWSYADHRMGNRILLVPATGQATGSEPSWMSLAQLWRSRFDDSNDPTGQLRQAQRCLRAARMAYLDGANEEFEEASNGLHFAVTDLGRRFGGYPPAMLIDWELAYNRYAPLRFAWILTLLASFALLLAIASKWRYLWTAGWALSAASGATLVLVLVTRAVLTGRVPVTSMYESVVFVAAGVVLMGGILEWIDRKGLLLVSATGVASILLLLAEHCPTVLDPGLLPLPPTLPTNAWLVIHVLAVTLGCTALALAMGIGNVSVGFYIVGSDKHPAIRSMTNIGDHLIRVGVMLLAMGILLGCCWADRAWGRFWSWEAREVWALVTLLSYLALLEARRAGWVQDFAFAALTTTGFSLVMVTWYGMNDVLAAGNPGFGFGQGGLALVLAMVLVQGMVVLAAAGRMALSPQVDDRTTPDIVPPPHRQVSTPTRSTVSSAPSSRLPR